MAPAIQPPRIPKLETFLDEYVAAAGIASDPDGPLFGTTGRSTGTPHRMTQQAAYRMIQCYAKRAGIKTRIGNPSMRVGRCVPAFASLLAQKRGARPCKAGPGS